MTPEQQLQSIVESLRLIAAPADLQLSLLPDFVCATDEVATTYGDAFLLVPQLVRAGLINEAAKESLAELDDWFEDMPRNSTISDRSSLRNHEFWETARKLAKNALRSLGEEVRAPDLSHISWID